MEPLMNVADTSRYVRRERDERVDGIVPFMSVAWTSKYVRFTRLPVDDGIVPPISVCDRFTCDT